MDPGVSQDVPFCHIRSHCVATSHKFVTPNPKGYHPVNGTNNGTKSGDGSQAAAHKNRLYIPYILEEEHNEYVEQTDPRLEERPDLHALR